MLIRFFDMGPAHTAIKVIFFFFFLFTLCTDEIERLLMKKEKILVSL